MYTYNIHYKSKDGVGLSPSFKTIKSAKEKYLNSLTWSKLIDYNDIREIVVFKGRKIHGYYDADFKLDKSKSAYFHNAFYGLD
jgi:nuclear transport factor 2 (NTF2) superfamily protein